MAEPPTNADPAVGYVGTQTCVKCHEAEHLSYLDTKHSESMERVDPDKEVSSATYHHDASGNDYEVFRRGDDLIHREIIRGVNGAELARTEHPIVFTLGSGTHGKSYVYHDGSHFGQSPLSWYEDTGKWSMSPGYDVPFHPGFGRKLSTECFFCHVGAVDRKRGNPNEFSILEEKIGCERCHGPGEKHVARYRENPKFTGADNTIVHPSKLSRELSEAICQQCHLQAAGKALRANRDEWDYRPGLPLTDFRIDYQYRLGDDTMRVVGHVEQLHQSKCYQQSESLTCITCHNPHQTVPAAAAIDHYRKICLSCHTDDSCGKPHAVRVADAQNDCSHCHMPAQGTEVPHTAFHHHRIGIHSGATTENEPAVGLSSVLDVARLPEIVRKRCEALAKFQVAQENPGNSNFRDYGIEAAKALIEVKNTGKSDPDATTILAMLARSQGQASIAGDLAGEVLAKELIPSRPRLESLRLLAGLAYQRREFDKAAEYYREVTELQSEPFDYFQLGVAEQNSGNTDAAINALKKTVELAPHHVNAHRFLAAIYQSQGRVDEAGRHSQLAQAHAMRLEQLQQKTLK
ncbi:Tetratricopeptide repeat protein [Stieleria maiorica]|uniref:Tetratricopeptide repeat protein n=1 Tax=Stieleria maiorica TaxID=2795974 RepID=A0A5B9MIB9_9BACT|nr:Tetratricopeptide repeat protein [Stieleria maiorica]